MRAMSLLAAILVFVSLPLAAQDTKAAQKPKQGAAAEAPKKAVVQKPQQPAAEEKAAPAGTEEPAQSDVAISRAVACTAIVDREPQGEADAFPRNVGKVYCFSHIKGVEDTLVIQHKWSHEGADMGTTDLTVKGVSWRTFSYRTIDPGLVGAWKVEIINASTGETLKTVEFSVE